MHTPRGTLRARFVINAAGVRADAVSALAGGETFRCWPRQGQYWLLDRELGARFRKVVGGVPDEHTRGIYCVPTTNRSLLLGPTADDREDPPDRAVTADVLERVLAAASRLVPAVRREYAIKTFAANRPASDTTYRLERDRNRANLIHAAGIRSTGVSGSPAIAEHVHELLAQAGAPVLDERPDAVTALDPLPRLLHHPRAGAAVRARSSLRPGGVRLRAGDRGRDRRRLRDGAAPALDRRPAQAHAGDRRPLPGVGLPGRRLVPVLAPRRHAALGAGAVRAGRHARSGAGR